MTFVRRVYENSKITIPKEIREIHGIETGDFIKVEIVEVIRARDAAAPPVAAERRKEA
ncbi:MAG TPA: AbrB/MazE/SpoVT family DNA-binding domain-containing protein [Candidatus Thermoplasmatota archaeon]|nr:AbrB/MazE/SpoVT family DNA-binding domain-containing protein [Candidatus Thermoplasmatota archaeon]